MDNNIEKFTGAVDVNGDVTPTTREKIEKVYPNKWQEMSTSELWEQKNILNTRAMYAQQANHPEIVPQILRGIAIIDQLIESKRQK